MVLVYCMNSIAITKLLQPFAFTNLGFCSLESPKSIKFYKSWLKNDFHGDMKYMEEHLPQKEYPQAHFDKMQGCITIAMNYYPHPQAKELPFKQLKIAKYAHGDDYHIWFKEKLNQAANLLKSHFTDQDFIGMTDSSPVLERDLAHRSGLGWVGKNTCLINREHGSFFFIGEIYTSLAFEDQSLTSDFCGTCNRCIESCPTGALKEPKVLDANLCISYLTIESKSIPSENLRNKMAGWFFGCDICQDVCPWNQHFIKNSLLPLPIQPDENIAELIQELELILNSSNNQLNRLTKDLALSRARGFGMKRNALLLVAELKLKQLIPDVKRQKEDPKLIDLADWTLDRLV